MKNVYTTALLFLLCFYGQAQTKNFIDQPYIEVNGSADTLVTPDEIFINILLSEKDSRDRVPVEEQEATMIAALAKLGIDVTKDLTTSYMASNFKTYLLKGKDVIKTKRYVLKVDNAEMASKVFIELEQLGISNTFIQRVAHSAMEQFKNVMRSKAVSDAKKRAISLLQPLQQNIGVAIHVTDLENAASTAPIYGSQLQEVVITGYGMRGVQSEDRTIEFEKIKVTASVNVKFVIK